MKSTLAEGVECGICGVGIDGGADFNGLRVFAAPGWGAGAAIVVNAGMRARPRQLAAVKPARWRGVGDTGFSGLRRSGVALEEKIRTRGGLECPAILLPDTPKVMVGRLNLTRVRMYPRLAVFAAKQPVCLLIADDTLLLRIPGEAAAQLH